MAFTTQAGESSTDYTTLLGTELADSVALTNDKVEISALAGNDTITAAGARDKIEISVGQGNDTLTFSGELLGADISLDKGNDTATFEDLTGTVSGGDGTDQIVVNQTATKAKLTGSSGNDTITVTGSAEAQTTLNGGADDDSITVTGVLNASTIYGGKQDDIITVTGGITNGKVRGDNDEDTINLGAGDLTNAFVMGGADNDTIDIASTAATDSKIFGGKGADSIRLTSTASLYVTGDNGDDQIVVTGTATSTLLGGEGADTISGGAGAESINGGIGADSLLSGTGNDTISGQTGADVITLQGGNNLVFGGADADTINVTSALFGSSDTVRGDGGTDVLAFTDVAANLTDAIYGNTSTIETLDVSEDDAGGNISITLGANAQAAGIVTVDLDGFLSANNRVLTTTAANYTGAITILGSDDANIQDVITGGGGADALSTGTQGRTDSMTGGAGVDTFTINNTNDSDSTILDLEGTDAFVLAGTTNTASTHVITVTGNYVSTAATSNGMTAANALVGTVGFDVNLALATGSGGYTVTNTGVAATLVGSEQADFLTGGAGIDSIVAGAGADTLIGGGAADAIVMGTGIDMVVSDTIAAANIDANADTVTNFTSGAGGDQVGVGLTGLNAEVIDIITLEGNVNVAAGDAIVFATLGATGAISSAANVVLLGGTTVGANETILDGTDLDNDFTDGDAIAVAFIDANADLNFGIAELDTDAGADGTIENADVNVTQTFTGTYTLAGLDTDNFVFV